jgi:hypothetical protein
LSALKKASLAKVSIAVLSLEIKAAFVISKIGVGDVYEKVAD